MAPHFGQNAKPLSISLPHSWQFIADEPRSAPGGQNVRGVGVNAAKTMDLLPRLGKQRATMAEPDPERTGAKAGQGGPEII
ncbi:hypothetical protein [Ensifer sp. BR816]|uniref:hypothetical protein n=1 Tax=Rhizobium sp. (strain BR816) TaxID=1057002 RepID=UPI00035D6FB8|nr:hypothetical protein [Ensifer sp. BR816]